MPSTLAIAVGRGLASAKPASPGEGYIYFSTDTGALERYSGSTWELISTPGGLLYEFSTTTTDGDPGTGILRFNHGTPASVTKVFFDDVPLNIQADIGSIITAADGARILISDIDNGGAFILGEITAVADDSGYFDVTVTIEDSGTLPSDGAVLQALIFGGSGGGGGGSSGPDLTRHFREHRFIYAHGTANLGQIQNIGGYTSFSGTTDGAGADNSRLANLWNATTTGLAYWRVNDTQCKPSMSPFYAAGFRATDIDDGFLICGWYTNATGPTASGDDFSGVRCALLKAVNGDTNFAFVTSDGGTEEETDTGVAIDTGWHDVEIVTEDAGVTWKCYLDGTLVATHTTNVPAATSGMAPGIWLGYINSSSRQFHANYQRVECGAGGKF